MIRKMMNTAKDIGAYVLLAASVATLSGCGEEPILAKREATLKKDSKTYLLVDYDPDPSVDLVLKIPGYISGSDSYVTGEACWRGKDNAALPESIQVEGLTVGTYGKPQVIGEQEKEFFDYALNGLSRTFPTSQPRRPH